VGRIPERMRGRGMWTLAHQRPEEAHEGPVDRGEDRPEGAAHDQREEDEAAVGGDYPIRRCPIPSGSPHSTMWEPSSGGSGKRLKTAKSTLSWRPMLRSTTIRLLAQRPRKGPHRTKSPR